MKKELKSPGFLTIKMSKLYEYDMTLPAPKYTSAKLCNSLHALIA